MSFRDLMAPATNTLFDLLGEPGSFAPAAGATVATQIIVDESVAVYGEFGEIVGRRVEVKLPVAKVAAARGGDRVTALRSTGNKSWALDKRLARDEYADHWAAIDG